MKRNEVARIFTNFLPAFDHLYTKIYHLFIKQLPDFLPFAAKLSSKDKHRIQMGMMLNSKKFRNRIDITPTCLLFYES